MATAAAEAGKSKRNVISVAEGCIGKGVRIAHYGCAGGDRVVRVALKEHDDRKPMAYPRFVALAECPACHAPHRAGLMWRTLNADEELAPEVLV
jgi:hypothetical protein